MSAVDCKKTISEQWLGVRHFQILMLFFGAAVETTVKVNMSIAIVAMTDKTQENTFDWSPSVQSIILSSFKWGFIVLLIPAGDLSTRFGGMPIMVVSVCSNWILCLLLPVVAATGSWQAVVTIRVIQGLGHGLMVPAMLQIISTWVPMEEKGRLTAFAVSGIQFGTVIQMVISGYIAEAWSWQGIYYVDGVCGIIWTIVYLLFGASTPESSKIITKEERDYIQNSLQQVGTQKKLKTPWKELLTSLPVFLLVLSFIGVEWGYWMLMTETPTYLQRVLGVDLKSNGVMTASLYLVFFIMCFPFGYISDYVLKRKWLRTITCRKIFHVLCALGPATAMLAICFVPPNTAIIVTILAIGYGLNSSFCAGDLLVYLDLSPNFSGIIVGICQFIGNIVGLNAPLVAGLLLDDDTNAKEWHKVFYLTASIYVITNVPFLIFGSCERQKWDAPVDDVTHCDNSTVENSNEEFNKKKTANDT